MGKRTKSSKRPHKGRRGAGGRNWLYLVFSAAIVLIIGIGGLMLFGNGDGSPQPQAKPSSLPSYVATAPFTVQAAYTYVAEHPETTAYVPCYCGCGRHSGHSSVHDCFVAGRGADGSIVYDPHGAGCDMCVDIVLITKRMAGKGESLTAVIKFVDDKYGYLGPPTDTPPIPQ